MLADQDEGRFAARWRPLAEELREPLLAHVQEILGAATSADMTGVQSRGAGAEFYIRVPAGKDGAHVGVRMQSRTELPTLTVTFQPGYAFRAARRAAKALKGSEFTRPAQGRNFGWKMHLESDLPAPALAAAKASLDTLHRRGVFDRPRRWPFRHSSS
jgi:hypothetical protein